MQAVGDALPQGLGDVLASNTTPFTAKLALVTHA